MICPEDEARKKWCPANDGEYCGASDCMVWRWRGDPDYPASYGKPYDEGSRLGYCGLAGVPGDPDQ